MSHENWIPIELFDKEVELDNMHFFGDINRDRVTDAVYIGLDASYWDGFRFNNGDGEFEPTHYLNPACYKKETL